MDFIVGNPSPIQFPNYHDMPKNPDKFFPKFHPNDPERTADEHIKIS